MFCHEFHYDSFEKLAFHLSQYKCDRSSGHIRAREVANKLYTGHSTLQDIRKYVSTEKSTHLQCNLTPYVHQFLTYWKKPYDIKIKG